MRTTIVYLGLWALVLGAGACRRSAPRHSAWQELDWWEDVAVVRHASGSCWLMSNRGHDGVTQAPPELCASYLSVEVTRGDR